MPRSKGKKLSSLFRSVKSTVSAAASKPLSASSSSSSSVAVKPFSVPAAPSSFQALRKNKEHQRAHNLIYENLYEVGPSHSGDSNKHVSREVSSILCGLRDLESDNDSFESQVIDDGTFENDSELSWFSNMFNRSSSQHRKKLSRVRKSKWIFKNTQKHRFDKLVSMCLVKLGTGATLDMLCKLGRESGLKEYSAFIKGCIEIARNSKDERAQIAQILEAYRLFRVMKERGLSIEEDTFGPLLLYLIDMQMSDEFFLFLEIVKDEDRSLLPRLGYYEMLFFIEKNDKEKIQELCSDTSTGEGKMDSLLHENYVLALCERDRKDELPQLLETIDITTVSSFDSIRCIFKSLGRLSFEHFTEDFIRSLKDCGTSKEAAFHFSKDCDHRVESISNLIYDYSTSMKNLAVEDVLLKFKEMHESLGVELLHGSYEMLIKLCCDSHKVHLALDIVDDMCKAGFSLSSKMLNTICQTCEDTFEFILVRRIHPMLHHHNLRANSETFRSLINLNIRMKDYNSAYAMLKDLENFNLMPTTSMYNAIIGGYYREKNRDGVLRVLEQMKQADVKPDSVTYSYLISNSECQEDITKYFEELKCAGVKVSKQISMALINAYAACGQFKKAKQVLRDKGMPAENFNEIKSVLLSTLASHGKISDALDIYLKINRSSCCLKPKAIISLIEHFPCEGELILLLQLLGELNDTDYWVEGCCRVILYCIRNKDLRSAVDLLTKLAVHFQDNEIAREVIFDEVFSQIAETDPPDLQFGLNLLQAIKKDLNIYPSRKCLDFLLNAGVNAKDLHRSQLVWKEYQTASFPYNSLSYLRMYQALLASGSTKAAKKLLNKVPKDDPHVLLIIQASDAIYRQSKVKKK